MNNIQITICKSYTVNPNTLMQRECGRKPSRGVQAWAVGGQGLLSEKLKPPLNWALKILIESPVFATPFFKRQAKIKPTVQFTGRPMYVNPVQRMAAYYQNQTHELKHAAILSRDAVETLSKQNYIFLVGKAFQRYGHMVWLIIGLMET